MKYTIILSLIMLSSCKVLCQKDLDTSYLYFPFTILFNYEDATLTEEEKQNLDYILDKYYYPYADSLNYNLCLTALECDDELFKKPKISMDRLYSICQYLIKSKGIKKESIILKFGIPNPKICENKDQQGVVIQYCR